VTALQLLQEVLQEQEAHFLNHGQSKAPAYKVLLEVPSNQVQQGKEDLQGVLTQLPQEVSGHQVVNRDLGFSRLKL